MGLVTPSLMFALRMLMVVACHGLKLGLEISTHIIGLYDDNEFI